MLDRGAPELVSAVERGQVSVSAAADVAEHFAGALHGSPTDVQHVGGVVLRGCANWRMLIRSLCQRRDLPRDHGPLALVEVPPVQVQRDDEAHRIVALVIPHGTGEIESVLCQSLSRARVDDSTVFRTLLAYAKGSDSPSLAAPLRGRGCARNRLERDDSSAVVALSRLLRTIRQGSHASRLAARWR